MTFHVINSSNSIHNTTNSASALTLSLGDDAIIMADGSVLATGTSADGIYLTGSAENSTLIVNGFVYGTSSGIYSLGQYAQITINGQVTAEYTGIRVQNSGYVYVSPTGIVSGSEGIAMSASTLVNDGTVNGTAGGNAIQMSSGWLTNNGLISSRIDSIFYGGVGAGQITNTGTIQGGLTTYYAASAATARLTIDNSGEWLGSLWLSPGADTVTNTGTITGDINLGDGNNSLDSRSGFLGGNVIAGNGIDTILLGAGDTIITAGGGADTIDGGAGYDIASYSSSVKGVSVDLLNGTASRGDAQGDILSNIEGLYGSLQKDVLVGDNGNNIINGLMGADTLIGNGGNDTIIMFGGGGTTIINGGSGNDLIQLLTLDQPNYGYAFRSVDQVNGGGGYDTLQISNAPTMTFTSTTVTNIERILLDDGFSYNFTSVNQTVTSGARLWVDGGSLTGNNSIRFDGSAETNGAFDFSGGDWRDTFIGGAGNDTFTGGEQKDLMTGGGGSDTFIYNSSIESKFGIRDQITDFNTADDTFQFDFDVTAIDSTLSGSVSSAADLAALVNGHFGASHAMLVNVTGGTLNGLTLLLVDADGVAGFQSATDYVIDVTGIVGTLTVDDFIIG